MPVGSLPLLAALAPPEHHVEMFDEVLKPIDFDHIKSSFDLIGVTGMITQNEYIFAILNELADYEGMLVVGGPYASISEETFSGSCDVIFVGEADDTWPKFVTAAAAGEPLAFRYEQSERTDMTTLPQPRYDLININDYGSIPVQFSRGCPFLCEFCDIITVFGRRPRTKEPHQVISELEKLAALGVGGVFLVDDNFIGNKKAAKGLLKEIAAWQRANDYPIVLLTEASINLADETELMDLMREANITVVFIGIESVSEASLLETRKVQNTRGDSIPDKVRRIRDHGIFVTAGFIVGFDSDGPDTFDAQETFINELNIAEALVGSLIALPGTPLHKRLEREGRLRPDQPSCNFEPAQMSPEELIAGTMRTNQAIYEPESYFDRFFGATAGSRLLIEMIDEKREGQRRSPLWKRLGMNVNALLMGLRFARALRRDGELRNLGSRYLKIYRQRGRHEGAASMPAREMVVHAIRHWHRYKLYKDMAQNSRFVTSFAFTETHQREREAA